MSNILKQIKIPLEKKHIVFIVNIYVVKFVADLFCDVFLFDLLKDIWNKLKCTKLCMLLQFWLLALTYFGITVMVMMQHRILQSSWSMSCSRMLHEVATSRQKKMSWSDWFLSFYDGDDNNSRVDGKRVFVFLPSPTYHFLFLLSCGRGEKTVTVSSVAAVD